MLCEFTLATIPTILMICWGARSTLVLRGFAFWHVLGLETIVSVMCFMALLRFSFLWSLEVGSVNFEFGMHFL
jgi:hypothetical protein